MANGCLSVRQIYYTAEDFKEKYGDEKSVNKFVDELFWRDFFKFWFVRHKDKPFYRYGTNDRNQYNWTADESLIKRWRDGTTGMPLIDGLMRELKHTGFMSNRGRQIVASYLT